jgi:hypothetical protein
MSRPISVSSAVFSSASSREEPPISKGKKKPGSTSGSRSALQELVNKIESMGHMTHTPIKNLDKKKQEELTSLREAAMFLRKGKSYNLVVDAIKRTFGSETNIQPSTVGAFFHGCFVANDFEGCLACSSLCAGSMPYPSVPGWTDCDKTVGVYSDGNLSVNYVNEKSQELLVHVVNGEFEGLSDEDVKKLRKMGIEKVTITSSNSSTQSSGTFSGTPESVCKKKSISSQLSSEHYETKSSSAQSKPSKSYENKSDGSCGWYIVVAVIVLLLLLFLLGFAYYYWPSSADSGSTKEMEVKTDRFYGPGYL